MDCTATISCERRLDPERACFVESSTDQYSGFAISDIPLTQVANVFRCLGMALSGKCSKSNEVIGKWGGRNEVERLVNELKSESVSDVNDMLKSIGRTDLIDND